MGETWTLPFEDKVERKHEMVEEVYDQEGFCFICSFLKNINDSVFLTDRGSHLDKGG